MTNITHLTADFATSPQITPSQMQQLKSAGFSTVICNRPDHEDAGQPSFAVIKAAAEAAGLEAHHIPVTPGQPFYGQIAAFDAAITAAKGKVLAYCRSGARAQNLYNATRR